MSPAAIIENQAEHGDKQTLALARGFVALLETAQRLTHQERNLQSRLQLAYDEYMKLSNSLPDASAETKPVEPIFIDPIQDGNDTTTDSIKWVSDVEEAGYVTTSGAKDIAAGLEISKLVLEKLKPRDTNELPGFCPVTAHATRRETMEQDFTTDGIKGNLHCPFVAPAGDAGPNGERNSKVCGNSAMEDPIAAELKHDAPPSVSRSAPRCPIRFLDNHSPEEIAKYFEKHKHQIPRSHSICIQRYQKDTLGVRQLDEKYGDVVNMVKGLGEYHQPYLSVAPDEDELPPQESVSAERVEKWAENVSHDTPPPEDDSVSPSKKAEIELNAEDTRESRFDRSLRDIRVGESPSRPWGIHVPLSPGPAPSAPSNWSPYDKQPKEPSTVPVQPPEQEHGLETEGRGCPFGHDKPWTFADKTEATEKSKSPPPPSVEDLGNEDAAYHSTSGSRPSPIFRTQTQEKAHPNLIFNGPVFFGYTAESAAVLLEKLGQGLN